MYSHWRAKNRGILRVYRCLYDRELIHFAVYRCIFICTYTSFSVITLYSVSYTYFKSENPLDKGLQQPRIFCFHKIKNFNHCCMYVVYCIHSQLPVINQSSVTCCMCITFYIHSQLPDQEALWRSWLYVVVCASHFTYTHNLARMVLPAILLYVHHILHTLTTRIAYLFV
jgi:hypothetical protein